LQLFVSDLTVTGYPPQAPATTTIHNAIGICSFYEPGDDDSGMAVFDEYGTRLPITHGDLTGSPFECFVPQYYEWGIASTTKYDVYYGNIGGWCYTNFNATRDQCDQNDGSFQFMRNYYFNSWNDILYWDSKIGSGSAIQGYTPYLSDQVAVAFMAPIFKNTMGAGFGVLQALMPYIVGLVVISMIIYFAFTAFRFFRGSNPYKQPIDKGKIK